MLSRLIDADKLRAEVKECKVMQQSENSDYRTGYICAMSTVEGMIADILLADEQVDAIPIRWIQGKIGYMQCKGNPWTAESLEWLLKAWAQENGHGKG